MHLNSLKTELETLKERLKLNEDQTVELTEYQEYLNSDYIEQRLKSGDLTEAQVYAIASSTFPFF